MVLVGQIKAIAIAVRNVSGRRRWSKLDEWLRLGALPTVEFIVRSDDIVSVFYGAIRRKTAF